MLSWKRKQKSSEVETATVGLVVGTSEVTAVFSDGEVDGRPSIGAWESFPIETPGDVLAGLSRFVDEHELAGQGCRCTLSANDYSLRLVERPENVPDEDLVEATRWLVRDLIEFDIETAELAILTLPADSTRARTPKMFVVAARGESVLDLAHAIDAAGLRLLGFEIVESTLLALEERMPEIVAGGAMVRLEDKASVLTLAHDNHLYLARTLNIDLGLLDEAAERALTTEDPASAEIIEYLDPLLLDVQRSLDYYESEYGQAPASRLSILPSRIDASPLVPALAEALRPIQIEAFELENYFSFPTPPPADLHQALAIAAGSTVVHSDLIADALLPRTYRPRDGGFGLSSVVRIAAAMLVLLGTYYGISRFQLEHKSTALSVLEDQRDALTQETDAAREQARISAESRDPEAEIAALIAQRDARISMLRDMTQRTSRSDASFSSLLSGLARQDLDDLWLERIEFTDGGDSIVLEGRSISPATVPTYLRGLGSEPSFEKRRFRSFELDRGDASIGSLAFRLATRDEKAEDEGSVR